MSLSKTEAIELAREILNEDPDLKVRPIPTPDGWLLVVHCGLFRFTVRSRDELAAALQMIFGQPSPETLIEAFAPQIKELASAKPLRDGMGVEDVMNLVTLKAIAQGVTSKDELMAIVQETIALAT